MIITSTTTTLTATLFDPVPSSLCICRVIKMIPHVVPNNPSHTKKKNKNKKKETNHKHTAVLLSLHFRLWMISMPDFTTS